jgi:hypothetical protein
MAKIKKDDGYLELENYRSIFVTVYPTLDNPYHAQGKSFQIHPKMAKYLEEKGYVTTYEPEGWVEVEDEEPVFNEQYSI